MRLRYRVPHGKESLLMFNEETKDPVAYVTVSLTPTIEITTSQEYFVVVPFIKERGWFC